VDEQLAWTADARVLARILKIAQGIEGAANPMPKEMKEEFGKTEPELSMIRRALEKSRFIEERDIATLVDVVASLGVAMLFLAKRVGKYPYTEDDVRELAKKLHVAVSGVKLHPERHRIAHAVRQIRAESDAAFEVVFQDLGGKVKGSLEVLTNERIGRDWLVPVDAITEKTFAERGCGLAEVEVDMAWATSVGRVHNNVTNETEPIRDPPLAVGDLTGQLMHVLTAGGLFRWLGEVFIIFQNTWRQQYLAISVRALKARGCTTITFAPTTFTGYNRSDDLVPFVRDRTMAGIDGSTTALEEETVPYAYPIA
jgi:hypothetical protein